MPDSGDILKEKSLSNGQIIALVFFAVTATFTVTKIVIDIENTKERIEYVKELESWIQRNFKYRFRKGIKEFSGRYLNDIISTNKDKCQKPILNVTINRTTGEITITKV